jgi:hypothetical protein
MSTPFKGSIELCPGCQSADLFINRTLSIVECASCGQACEERRIEVLEHTVLTESDAPPLCAVTPDFDGRGPEGAQDPYFETADFVTAFAFMAVHQDVLLTTAVRSGSAHLEQLDRAFGDLLQADASEALRRNGGEHEVEEHDELGPLAHAHPPKLKRGHKRGTSPRARADAEPREDDGAEAAAAAAALAGEREPKGDGSEGESEGEGGDESDGAAAAAAADDVGADADADPSAASAKRNGKGQADTVRSGRDAESAADAAPRKAGLAALAEQVFEEAAAHGPGRSGGRGSRGGCGSRGGRGGRGASLGADGGEPGGGARGRGGPKRGVRGRGGVGRGRGGGLDRAASELPDLASPGGADGGGQPRADDDNADLDGRSILSAYFTMLELAQRLQIDADVVEHAIHLFRMCATSISVRHRSIDPLATAAMIAACAALDKPRSLADACAATGTSERDAARYLKLVCAALEADTAGEADGSMDKASIALHMARVMPKFCQLLKLPPAVEKLATHMAEVRGRGGAREGGSGREAACGCATAAHARARAAASARSWRPAS